MSYKIYELTPRIKQLFTDNKFDSPDWQHSKQGLKVYNLKALYKHSPYLSYKQCTTRRYYT